VSFSHGMLREVEEGGGGRLSCLIKWVARLLVALGAWCLVGPCFRAFEPNCIAMDVENLRYSSLLDSSSLYIDISII